jgi:hypothetical protein
MGALAFMVSFPGMILGMVMTIRMFFGTRTPENQAAVDAGAQAYPHLAFITDPWFWCSLLLFSSLLFIFSEWAHPESQRNRSVMKQIYLPWPPVEFELGE